MADKSFGVEQLNVLGSGTPTISAPNQLNLDCHTVGISTSLSVGENVTVSGVSTFVGVTTFKDDIFLPDAKSISIGNGTGAFSSIAGLDFLHSGNGFISNSGGVLNIVSVSGDIRSYTSDNFSVFTNNSEQAILATKNGSVALYHDGGNKKLETNSSGVTITGTLGATAVTGDGSGLTNLPTIAGIWTVTNNSASNYVISGPGGLSSANNPDLYLERGKTYQFAMNASGHGFGIQTSSGTWNNSNAYTTGITNPAAQTGTITFAVPYSAPARLYYACTSGHSGMVGNLYIQGAASTVDVSNNADNRIITGGSGSSLNGESGLTYDGSTLGLAGSLAMTGGSISLDGHSLIGTANFTDISGGSYAARLGSTGSSTMRSTQIYGGGNHLATFDGVNIRLGINETTPEAGLHVTGGLPSIRLENSGTSASAGDVFGKIDFKHNDSDDAGITAIIQCVAEDSVGNSYLAFHNGDGGNADERIRIGSSGQFGIAGANYGSSGQVLTSQGSSSAPTWASSPLSNRNLIINGAMLVDQRGDYSTTNSNASRQYGGPDRFHQYYYQSDESARYTFKQGGSGVSPVEQGFSRTAILDVTTAQATVDITAGQAIWTSQRIEANNASHLKYGHSDAESVTLSFWIKSSVIGNYSITYGHTNMDERYITTYTVNVADTWEKKIITIPGDTRSGKTISPSNGRGLELKWVWLAGSSRLATPNQWATQGNKYGASGVTLANIFSSASNNLYLTGVQLEIGTTATPFEHIPFADELARCQRYFVKFAGGSDAYCFPAKGQGSSSCDIGIPLPTALRAQPSITLSNHRYFSSHSGGFSSSTNTPSVIHYNSPSGTTGSPMISLNAGGHSSSNNATGTFTPQGSSFSIDAEL